MPESIGMMALLFPALQMLAKPVPFAKPRLWLGSHQNCASVLAKLKTSVLYRKRCDKT
jgi:hypothetical protein